MKTNRSIQRLSFLSIFAVLLIASAQSQAAVLYVDSGAPGSNNGTSWTDAYTDLQSALGSAVLGDAIWVAEGTYYPTSGVDRTATFQLVTGVAVYGGFAGTETMLSERDWETHATILSGDIGVSADSADNSYHVITGTGTDATAVLDGFRVTKGNANGAVPHDRGGGMINEFIGRPTVAHVRFMNNSASGPGGGMYDTGDLTLTDVGFTNNRAGGDGGGMNTQLGAPILTEVLFDNNSAGGNGGGLHNWQSTLTLTNVTFSNNRGRSGGGMYLDGGSFSQPVTLTDVEFIGNWASAGSGGGMHSFRQSFIFALTNVSFCDNIAELNGGGMYNFSSDPVLTNVVFDGNAAFGSPELRTGHDDRYVAPAQGQGGGGMNNESASPTLTNVTFSNNSADEGGGMLNHVFSFPLLVNTILWGNTAGSVGAQIYNLDGNSIPTISYSSIEGCGGSGGGWDTGLGTDNGNNIDADPMFKGASLPSAPLSVWSSSPAVDAGNDAAVPGGVTTDIDGNTRIVGTVDMGAYEHQGPPTGIDDGNLPIVTALRSVFPNPFNPAVTIEFDMDLERHVEMTIYDARGSRVRTLLNEVRDPGVHRLVWDGRNNTGQGVSTGVYFLRFSSGGNVTHRKLVMLK